MNEGEIPIWTADVPAASDRSGGREREDDGSACKEAGIVEQTYFRRRKEHGGIQVDQAKRPKELAQENAKLGRTR